MSSDAKSGGGTGPVTLEQLIALNEELAALSRAGLPLERGLLESARDLPGRLRGLTEMLGKKMSAGASLSEALRDSGDAVPPLYRAVVDAGVRSGRLASALEGLAIYARGYNNARRSIGLALWYPLIVVILAYSLFSFLVYFIIPKFEAVMYDLGLAMNPALRALAAASRLWATWWWVFPLLLFLFVASFVASRRALGLGKGSRRAFGVLRWFPWFGRMMADYEAAGFARLLALLVENEVPYPEALRLAGEASGDPAIAKSSLAMAAAVEKGEPAAAAAQGKGPSAFPPLLRWVIASGNAQGNLVPALRQMSDRYATHAQDQADKIRVLLPTILLFGVGATATMLYALALFTPLASIWTSLSLPAN